MQFKEPKDKSKYVVGEVMSKGQQYQQLNSNN